MYSFFQLSLIWTHIYQSCYFHSGVNDYRRLITTPRHADHEPTRYTVIGVGQPYPIRDSFIFPRYLVAINSGDCRQESVAYLVYREIWYRPVVPIPETDLGVFAGLLFDQLVELYLELSINWVGILHCEVHTFNRCNTWYTVHVQLAPHTHCNPHSNTDMILAISFMFEKRSNYRIIDKQTISLPWISLQIIHVVFMMQIL